MTAPFDVGDCVVCVDDAAYRCHHGARHLGATTKRGLIVRVRSFGAARCGCPTITWGGGFMEQAMASRFRKIDADVTEDFRAMLRRVPVVERVGG